MAQISPLFQDEEVITEPSQLQENTSKTESHNCNFGELEETGSMGIPNTWAEGEAFTSAEDVFDISTMPILSSGYDEDMPLLEIQPDNAFSGPYNSPEPGATIFGAEPKQEEDVRGIDRQKKVILNSICNFMLPDENAVPGVCGIRNIGNTCFLNSGLQCLLNNRTVLAFLLQNLESLLANKDLLASKFVAVALKIWSGHYTILNVAEFKESVSKYHAQFEDFRQHDCQEFLALLLDTLHEQLNTASKGPLGSSLAIREKCLTSPSDLTFDDKMVEYDPNETRSDLTDYNEDGEAVIEESLESENIVAETSSVARLKAHVPNINSSDASSSHSTSPRSTDSLDSWKANTPFRYAPIPDNVMPFTDVAGASPTTSKMSTSSLSPEKLESSPSSHSESTKKQSFSNDVLDNIIPIEKLTRHSKSNVVPSSSINASSLKRGSSYLSEGCAASPSTSDPKGERKLEKNELATQLNNVCQKVIPSLEDFVKDSKTLNTNVLINEEPNNQLKFDSEKFPKTEPHRLQETVDNLSVLANINTKQQSSSHVKATNLLKDTDSQVCKRIKLDESLEKVDDEAAKCNNEEDSSDSIGSELLVKSSEPDVVLEEEADNQWAKYQAQNQSIVVETFQGQFQSTVVCAECSHVSVTYEPFMYLPVPLPYALEKQIVVTFVPFGSPSPVRYLVTVNKHDKFQKVREGLLKLLGELNLELALAEVKDCHITKFVEDGIYVRFGLNQEKMLYAFELMPAPEPLQPTADMIPGPAGDICKPGNSQGSKSFRICVICLEEIPLAELMVHPSCMCVLCFNCLELSCSHFGRDNLTCPVCNAVVRPQDEFIPVTSLGLQPITINVISVPVVFRLDHEFGITLFGHPAMVRLPTCVLAGTLYEHVDKYVPYLATYSLLLVNEQGKTCCRCGYLQKCTGCEIARSGEIILHAGESLAVRFTDLPEETIANSNSIQEHKSMELLRPKDYLTLYDCLNAFSESEILDDNNPWSCPSCCRNQRAFKSLSLWRCPDTLMVYLKRFVFQDYSSTKADDKVVFPLESLDLSRYIAGPQNTDLVYNLQACICHFGNISSGHYMAYTKHATTGEWYNFNDDVYTRKSPQEEDFNHAYILFYQKPSSTEGPFSQQELLNHIINKLPSIPS